MTYVVLARKWRPQSFKDLIGQEAISRTLANAIELGKVPHAILFTGTRGVGKTTSARILAKALNCEKGPTPTPCQACANCLEISSGTNVDVLEIDGASNTSVDDVRDLKETVRYAPSKSKHKIYIIDEVHMLSTSAFNALLKTLEEPPPGVIFIFATTEPHKIPDTIHSRCQRFDFKQVSDAEIAKHLLNITRTERIELSEPAHKLIARQAFGSMRDAISLLEQVIAFSGGSAQGVSDDQVASILGLTDRALIVTTLEMFVKKDTAGALDAVAEVFSKGFEPKVYLEEIWEKVRDLMILKSTGETKLLNVTSDEAERMKSWVTTLSLLEIERWFDILKYACQEVSRVQFPRYLIEFSFLKITQPQERIPLADLLTRLEKLESGAPRTTSSSAAPLAVKPAPVYAAPTAEKKTLNPDWSLLVDEVKKQKPSLAAILLQAKQYSIDAQVIHLSFNEGSFYADRAKDKDFQSVLGEITKSLFGTACRVSVEVSAKASPALSESTTPVRSIEKEALEHPVVKKAISMFQAKIEDIKPPK